MHTKKINQKFTALFEKIIRDDFLKMENLSGDIPFHVFTFEPEEQVEVDKAITGLMVKLKNQGIQLLDLNLYDILIELLNAELGEGVVFELEEEMNRDDFVDAVLSTVNLDEVFIPEIKRRINNSDADLYFITGVGLAYPLIRSHKILNNIQSIAVKSPTVIFYPGDYDGKYLRLFGRLKKNYYKAFKL